MIDGYNIVYFVIYESVDPLLSIKPVRGKHGPLV